LERAGIDAATPDPPGGRIERRPDGSPSGVLVDGAVDPVARLIPAPDVQERRARLRSALAHCSALGLTGVHDAAVSRAGVEDMRTLLAAGELPLRVVVMWDATPGADTLDLAAARAAGPQPFDPTWHLQLRTVKLMADGALGSRGAALLEPYADAPEQRGLPRYTPEAFYALARPLHAAGFQLATHCIGDAANRMVLDTYERLQRELPRPDTRHRIEHAQILAPADLPRFAALHVLPSMQPTHCTSDMPWAPLRLGPQRLAGAYAWRSLRETGVIIPAGSDAPVESAAPCRGHLRCGDASRPRRTAARRLAAGAMSDTQ
jgi:predicted amidohydrolase YtcJ